MTNLIETLATELERPRELPTRVINYISGTYEVDRDDVGTFLVERLPKLEDDEIDLILSPLFTPKLADQAVFAGLLGKDNVSRDQWPGLIAALVARPTRAVFVMPGSRRYSVDLREPTVERYVQRLRLDATISEPVFELLNRKPSPDRPMLKAISRRAAWDNDAAREILVRYLSGSGESTVSDAVDLLNLMENRKPANLDDLVAKIPRWRDTLQQQIDVASGGKPFFSQNVQNMHGGGRDQRQADDLAITAKENEIAFLGRLQTILGNSAQRRSRWK